MAFSDEAILAVSTGFDGIMAGKCTNAAPRGVHHVRPLKRKSVALSPEELMARRPVWEALSDLFLDTDVSVTRDWRIEALAGSPYSVGELQSILGEEVYPICKYNLLSIAGEWSGFDPEWLERKIQRRLASPWGFLHAFNLGRLTVHLSSEWRTTKVGILATRNRDSTGVTSQAPRTD